MVFGVHRLLAIIILGCTLTMCLVLFIRICFNKRDRPPGKYLKEIISVLLLTLVQAIFIATQMALILTNGIVAGSCWSIQLPNMVIAKWDIYITLSYATLLTISFIQKLTNSFSESSCKKIRLLFFVLYPLFIMCFICFVITNLYMYFISVDYYICKFSSMEKLSRLIVLGSCFFLLLGLTILLLTLSIIISERQRMTVTSTQIVPKLKDTVIGLVLQKLILFSTCLPLCLQDDCSLTAECNTACDVFFWIYSFKLTILIFLWIRYPFILHYPKLRICRMNTTQDYRCSNDLRDVPCKRGTTRKDTVGYIHTVTPVVTQDETETLLKQSIESKNEQTSLKTIVPISEHFTRKHTSNSKQRTISTGLHGELDTTKGLHSELDTPKGLRSELDTTISKDLHSELDEDRYDIFLHTFPKRILPKLDKMFLDQNRYYTDLQRQVFQSEARSDRSDVEIEAGNIVDNDGDINISIKQNQSNKPRIKSRLKPDQKAAEKTVPKQVDRPDRLCDNDPSKQSLIVSESKNSGPHERDLALVNRKPPKVALKPINKSQLEFQKQRNMKAVNPTCHSDMNCKYGSGNLNAGKLVNCTIADTNPHVIPKSSIQQRSIISSIESLNTNRKNNFDGKALFVPNNNLVIPRIQNLCVEGDGSTCTNNVPKQVDRSDRLYNKDYSKQSFIASESKIHRPDERDLSPMNRKPPKVAPKPTYKSQLEFQKQRNMNAVNPKCHSDMNCKYGSGNLNAGKLVNCTIADTNPHVIPKSSIQQRSITSSIESLNTNRKNNFDGKTKFNPNNILIKPRRHLSVNDDGSTDIVNPKTELPAVVKKPNSNGYENIPLLPPPVPAWIYSTDVENSYEEYSTYLLPTIKEERDNQMFVSKRKHIPKRSKSLPAKKCPILNSVPVYGTINSDTENEYEEFSFPPTPCKPSVRQDVDNDGYEEFSPNILPDTTHHLKSLQYKKVTPQLYWMGPNHCFIKRCKSLPRNVSISHNISHVFMSHTKQLYQHQHTNLQQFKSDRNQPLSAPLVKPELPPRHCVTNSNEEFSPNASPKCPVQNDTMWNEGKFLIPVDVYTTLPKH